MHSHRLAPTLAFFLALILQGCATSSPAATTPPPPTVTTPTPTAFRPATPTPSILHVWISPAVPEPMRREVEALAARRPERLVLVPEPQQADARLEPKGAANLATWIYAAAAPFPTVQDDIAFEQLQAAWRQGLVWAASDTAAAMETLLGPAETSSTIAPVEELLDRAWAGASLLAIVPFEALEPRWKVLTIGGASPLRREFDAERYPLRLEFGLSGEPWAVDALQQSLGELPSSNRDPDRLTVLVMTGVTALTRATAAVMEMEGVTYPAALIGDWLRQADLTHVSNEVSFTPQCPVPTMASRGLRFCSHPAHIRLLEEIGVDIVELTGNHVLDWGTEPFLYSLDLYRERGWWTFGGGQDLEHAWRPALIEHNGQRLAFLGCNIAGPETAWATETRPGAAPCDFERLSAEIARLQAEGFLPIVTFQWWESRSMTPLPPQRAAFRAAAEAGAVIVSGSQAHRPMSFEFHHGAFIHYGLGNLFFDQMDALETRQVLIDRHVFYDGRHIGTEVFTALIENYAQPRPLTPEERAALLSSLFRASGWQQISP